MRYWNRDRVIAGTRAARCGLCLAGMLCCAAGAVANEDLDYDILILKNGQQKPVLIDPRPAKLGNEPKLSFKTPSGPTIFVNRAEISRIKYREERQIEAMQQLCESGRFEEAEDLIAPLYFAMQEWPAGDTQVPWDTFNVCRLRIRLNAVERTARDGQPQAALEQIDALRDEAGLSPGARQLLQRTTERIVGTQISAALEQADWPTARRWLDALQSRFPGSAQARDAQRRLVAEAERLSLEAGAARRAGDTEQALSLLRRAQRIAPKHAATRDALRELLRQSPHLTCGFVGGSTKIDACSHYSYTDNTIGQLCYRSLFRRRAASNEDLHVGHVGDLAQSWSIDSGNTKIEIRLDPNAHWSDGAPITAYDVEHTLELLRDLHHPPCNERLARLVEEVSVSESEETVVVRFRVQPPALLDELCIPILPSHRPQQQLPQALSNDYVVSGPFRPAHSTDDEIVLVPNEHFDPATAPAIIQLRLQLFQTRAAALQALRDGELQLLAGLTSHDVNVLRETVEGLRVGATRTRMLHCIGLNDAWFGRQSEPRTARLAVASALNRADAQSGLVGENVALGLFPAESWAGRHERETLLPSYDPSGSRQLLASDKQLADRPLRFVYPESGLAAEAARRCIADLQAVGLNVRDHGLTEAMYRTRVFEEREFELAYLTHAFADPFYEVAPLFRLDGGGNFMGIQDGRLSRLTQERLTTIDRRRIREKTDQLERFALHELYLIPLWHSGHWFAHTATLEGLASQPQTLFDNIEHWRINPDRE